MSKETSQSKFDAQGSLTGEYDPREVESRWQQEWVDQQTYTYDPETADPDLTFTIDTPPPTVSGSLHMGHLYGFTLQDMIARFRRMYDGNALYPFGYDDNGIASERLTERELGIQHGDFSRREFQEKCREVCQEYESEFTEKVQGLGASVDWTRTYKTIEPRVQQISQLSFIDLYEQGREYRQRAPAIWCPECQTAISQVEMEDAERDSHYNDIAFTLKELGGNAPEAVGNEDQEYPTPVETGDDIVISTTRPELLPACVAMFVHPEDKQNAHLVGGTAEVPLFEHEVPIYADERVDMDTGTGVVMCCTFGDQTDIEWYQAHDLDLRVAIDETATLTELADDYEGMSTHEARDVIVEDLDDEGLLLDRRAITHTVNVHERCETDVEFRVTEQWYVELLDKTDEYLEAGRKMDWYPEKMFTRYQHWIEGLEWDWCISRQRDSGIPFPVWYCEECNEEILADRDDLPVDPIQDEPPVDECPACGSTEFKPEEDVFDTWATSSLTPLVNCGWDPEEVGTGKAGKSDFKYPGLYPMSLRPQGHDIISFWLFHTIVKCYEHTGEVPFESVMINGMVLDENREAMSKSKGNVVVPDEVLAEFPVDATRFWAAGTSIGDDFPFKEGDLEAGEKLLRKIWNASKLVDQLTPETVEEPASLTPIDEWLLARLDTAIETIADHLLNYEFSKARNKLRMFFWNTFCDDYLEIAKQRLDGGSSESTEYTLITAHRVFLKMFAPLLPHITEEIWQAMYANEESIHTTTWPDKTGYDADIEAGETAMEVISALRRYKTDNQMPLNATLDDVIVYGDVTGFEDAITDVMHVNKLETTTDEAPITTEVVDVNLDYATVGPKYGGKVSEFDAAIEAGEFEDTDNGLEIAGETLAEDVYELQEERTYAGEGEMVEAGGAVVIVKG
ncbi:valine--tRNA ligase [Salinarchaeum sp. IM2453]|uniref:valine--tRNA ligase n=1 Tax=Salinarchaeum sp. IM2453 TaxID=2862870 RepID=UPI001C837093|nr:valine--tRNA ligase [Salinarchaeum sp. IM2453]QZA89302.1 valine--tRNA ligase [Salinarchaeum sp. IM2453]